MLKDSRYVIGVRCFVTPSIRFTNVKFLKLEHIKIDVYDMMICLANFPNVRTLVVELVDETDRYYEHKRLEFENEFENISPLSYLSQLTIEISTHEATSPSDILRFIELLLKHCWVLEKLVVIGPYNIRHMFELEYIMSFPRASPMAQVILGQTDCHQRRVPWSD